MGSTPIGTIRVNEKLVNTILETAKIIREYHDFSNIC